MGLDEMWGRTLEILKSLEKQDRKMGIEARFIDMVEEIGELANAILTERGHKSMKRKKSEIADSICDVLFDLLALAKMLKLNLAKEYEKMLKEMEERIRKGEFRRD